MRSLIKIALGFLLLVSAAAAMGNDNCVSTKISQEASGNCITGNIDLAQITDAASYVFGNNNDVDQCMKLDASCNYLTGMGKYPSILCQMGDMVGNATGCDNHVSQDIRLKTDDNSMCGGMLTQLSTIVSND